MLSKITSCKTVAATQINGQETQSRLVLLRVVQHDSTIEVDHIMYPLQRAAAKRPAILPLGHVMPSPIPFRLRASQC